MSLKQPLDSDLSPLANWLLILVLFVPLGLCLTLLEVAQLGSWQTALVMAGMVAVSAVTAALWKRSRIWRGLPILFGLMLGVGVKTAGGGINRWGLLEAMAAGLTIGLGLLFSIWMEMLGDRRGTPPDSSVEK